MIAALSPRVHSYPLPLIYPASADFAVTVNGVNVPVTAFAPEPGGGVEYHYAHFSFRGTVSVQVSTRRKITSYSVSPLALEIPAEVSGHTLAFTLDRSRYLIVKIDDLRASMQMGQPFPGVWLPHNLGIHAGLSLALGSMELSYKREFSNYRKADVTSKIRVPK